MLSLVEATPAELRAIADFYEDPQHAIDDLLDLSLLPIVEYGDGKPDKLIGFERGESDAVAR